jgi:broad specificity phosphatase PhoE
MKQVLILRHATWNLKDDTLTAEAKGRCQALKAKLPALTIVISSPFGRAKETAQLLSGKDPVEDNRASFPNLDPEVAKQIALARLTHPLGVAGAIFAIPAAREPYRKQAMLLLDLIKDTFEQLKDDQTALIASHDGIMVALDKLLDNASFEGTDHTYNELEGFYIDPSLNQTPFKPEELH